MNLEQSSWRQFRRVLRLGIAAAMVLALHADAAGAEPGRAAGALSAPGDMAGLRVVKESQMNGRRVVLYQHAADPAWGYAKNAPPCPFYLVHPLKQVANPPLLVVLHSAGGGVDEALPSITKPNERGFYGDETFYVLCLDCPGADYWWGWHAIRADPKRYADELTPAEKRLLATIEWTAQKTRADRNRIYLNGISMGGSGSMGLGIPHGNVFAAVAVVVPAGVEHVEHRTLGHELPDPPPLFNISSQVDGWSKGEETLLAHFASARYALFFAWGPFGHKVEPAGDSNRAVYEFPWLSIRRNEAYPVFTQASTDHKYPGFRNVTAPDQRGQINGYFRWRNLEDSDSRFAMELRLVRAEELKVRTETPPAESVATVTMRRMQKFKVAKGAACNWAMNRNGKVLQSGRVIADDQGHVTVDGLRVGQDPAQFELRPAMP
jgi:hypothetical protein